LKKWQKSFLAKKPDRDELRDIVDTNAVRRHLYNNVLDAFNNIGDLSNVRHTMSLHDVHYADPEDFDLRTQKQAILGGKTLQRRVRGTWRLRDAVTGGPLGEKLVTLGQVPYITPRGTFVVNGTDYTLANQPRLRSGIFARVKANGELESHVNILPGQGLSHHYLLDPSTSVFHVKLAQSKVPLMPLLRAMGVKDSELREAWGDELTAANMQANSSQAVAKLYNKLIRKRDPNLTDETRTQAVVNAFQAMKLDPEVTGRTLGAPHTN